MYLKSKGGLLTEYIASSLPLCADILPTKPAMDVDKEKAINKTKKHSYRQSKNTISQYENADRIELPIICQGGWPWAALTKETNTIKTQTKTNLNHYR